MKTKKAHTQYWWDVQYASGGSISANETSKSVAIARCKEECATRPHSRGTVTEMYYPAGKSRGERKGVVFECRSRLDVVVYDPSDDKAYRSRVFSPAELGEWAFKQIMPEVLNIARSITAPKVKTAWSK